jgi:predicted RND superfamily exporter protein
VRWLDRLAIARPRAVILAALVVVAVVAPGAARLELRTDGHALVPADAPAVRLDEAIRAEFRVRDQVLVVVESEDERGIFNPGTIRLVADLTDEIAALEGVDPRDVISLATERGLRVREGTLDFRRLLEPRPESPAALDQLRTDLEKIRLYTGTIVSRDGGAAAIVVGVRPDAHRAALCRRLGAVVAARAGGPERVSIVGAPVAESLLGTHLMEDLGVPSAVLGAPTITSAPAADAGWTWHAVRRRIGRHVGLVPVALVIMALVFAASFRSAAAVLLPLTEVGACLAIVFGTMGWAGVPVYLTIAVMPVILTAIGIADEIHIFTRYRQLARAGTGAGDARALVARTMDQMRRPVVKTSLTSAAAFASFAVSPIDAVRAFGLFTALGVLVCMAWSLTVIPACLVLRRPPATREADARPRANAFAGLADLVVRRRWAVLGAAALVAVLAPFGVRRIVVQDSWIDGFAPESEFRRATDMVNDRFHGTHILLLAVDTGGEILAGDVPASAVETFRIRLRLPDTVDADELVGQWIQVEVPDAPPDGRPPEARGRHRAPPARIVAARRAGNRVVVETEPTDGTIRPEARPREPRLAWHIAPRRLLARETIDRLCAFERFLETLAEHEVGGVVGTCDYVVTTNYILAAGLEQYRRVPPDPRRMLIVWQQFGRVRELHRLREIIDAAHGRSLIAVYMTNANFVATARLIEAIRAYEREHLAPHGVSVELAGDVAVSQALIGGIVSTQVRSLLLSLVGVVVVAALLGRSLAWGVCCVIPCAGAVLVNFALMGVVGMPLGVATSMFAAMTLGIGVDYAIHLTERWREASASGADAAGAAREALVVTGPALVVDALAIAIGFGVLVLSQVPANARLGLLVASSVLACLAATVLVLPALLAVAGRGRTS